MFGGVNWAWREEQSVRFWWRESDNLGILEGFLQGVSVAASPVLATIGMSVCPSVRHTLALSENDAS